MIKENEVVIGDQASIKLGLLAAVVSLGIGMFCGAIWWTASWSSSIQVKLDNIVLSLSQASEKDKAQNIDILDLQKRISAIEIGGSPALRSMDTELKLIRKEFDAHVAKPNHVSLSSSSP